MTAFQVIHSAQRGMALLMSLVFLSLLTLIGVSSMQNATLQEKMAGSLSLRNQSFQRAEAALRMGESAVRRAADGRHVPPGVTRVAVGEDFYEVQRLGTTLTAVNLPNNTQATLYRITAVGLAGHSRTVLESIYATFTASGSGNMRDTPVHGTDITSGGGSRRIMWRQVE